MTTVNNSFIKARQISAKQARIMNMRNKSYKFRLNALLASDSRQGQVWGV